MHPPDDATANLPPSLRPIACFALEIARFVCDPDTRIKIEKLRSKGVAMYVSAYYACTGNQLISTWAEPSEMNAKVELRRR